MNFKLLRLPIVAVLICSCSNKYDVINLSDDNIIQMDVEEICTDIQIIPIKSSSPMKGIETCLHFGEYDFLLSSDKRTLYWVKDDSVISQLDKGGRGRGEYLEINAFAYSPVDSLLYVANPNGLNIYKGLNYELKYVLGNVPSINTLRVLENNILLAGCYVADNDMNERNGLFIIDVKNGVVSDPLISMNSLSKLFHNETVYYQTGDSLYISVGDRAINSIYLYCKGELTQKLQYMYSKKLQIPKRVMVKNPDNISDQIIFNDYLRSNDFCVGGFLPIVRNQGDCYMFWNAPKSDDFILNIIEQDQIKRIRIGIPGLEGLLAPNWVSNDSYVSIYQNWFHGTKEENYSNGFSELSEKLLSLSINNDDNPVLIKYRIK